MRPTVSAAIALAALFVLFVLDRILPSLIDPYVFQVLIYLGINITLATSLNMVFGIAGQFSMGHAGFMAIGGYVAASITFFGGPVAGTAAPGLLLTALLGGGLAAAAAGWLVGLPSLRLTGDYLAIVTLGFGEIIRVIILNIETVGGARGFSGVPALGAFGPLGSFFWVYLVATVTVVVSIRLVGSSHGRALLAVRENEVAAEACGVNSTHYKVLAFVMAAFFAGIAGGLFGHFLQYLNPNSFTFIKSFEIVIMVVLGGLGSVTGAIVGAGIVTILPEGLRRVKDLNPAGTDPRMVIFAILLIVLMLTRPSGIMGTREIWDLFRRKPRSAKLD